MKKFILAFLMVLALAMTAHSQSYVSGVAQQVSANSPFVQTVAGATITVCMYSASPTIPCTSTVSIFSDSALSVSKANPFTADSQGNYAFFIAPGIYTVTITGASVTGQAMTVTAAPSGNASIKPAASDGVYFVSGNGNDSLDGRSWGSAFLTVTAAETACGSVIQCKIFVATNFTGTIPTNPTSDNISIVKMGGEEWLQKGTFDNSAYFQYHSISVGGCSPSGLYSSINGGNETAGLASCIAVPSTATERQNDALVGLVSTAAGANSPAVGVTGGCVLTAANGRCFGFNFLASDNNFSTAALNGGEIDVSVNTPTTQAHGINMSLFGSSTPAAHTQAYDVTVGSTNQWPGGFECATGATPAVSATQGCFIANPEASGTNQPSQGLLFISNDPTSGQHAANFELDPAGDVELANTVSGAGLKASSFKLLASGGGSITHQAPNTASNFTITDPAATGTIALTSQLPVALQTTSDVPVTGTGFGNVTGLSFSVAASTSYRATCVLYMAVTAGTAQFTFTGPASPTTLEFASQGSAAISTFGNTAGFGTISGTTMQVVSLSLINGANAGTVQLQINNNTGGDTTTAKAGSFCIVQ